MKDRTGVLRRACSSLFAFDDTTYDSIHIILNAQSDKEKDQLTEKWQTHKLEELNFIGIVASHSHMSGSSSPSLTNLATDGLQGALLAGCLTSTGDWPNVLGNGRTQPWTVTSCWYAGIVCALFAVLTVAQQAMRLHRLSAHRDGMERIRKCMASRKLNDDGELLPDRLRIHTWQVGPALLTASVLCMVIGMGIMLWVGAQQGPLKKEYEEWWDANAKMAVTWTIVLAVVIAAFVASQFGLDEG